MTERRPGKYKPETENENNTKSVWRTRTAETGTGGSSEELGISFVDLGLTDAESLPKVKAAQKPDPDRKSGSPAQQRRDRNPERRQSSERSGGGPRPEGSARPQSASRRERAGQPERSARERQMRRMQPEQNDRSRSARGTRQPDRAGQERQPQGGAGIRNTRQPAGEGRPQQRRPERRPAAQPARQRRPEAQSARPRRPEAGQRTGSANSGSRKGKSRQENRVFSPGFKKGFLIAWGIFVVLLVAVMIILWSSLKKYESGLPEHYMKQILKQVGEGELEELHLVTPEDISIDDPSLFLSKEQIAGYLKQKGEEAELEYVKVNAESSENENVYIIRSGEEKLLKVFLDRDTDGSKGWHETKTQMTAEKLQLKDIVIQIPSSASLEIDQKPIDRSLITETGAQIQLLSNLINMGILAPQPTVDTYVVRGIFADPEIIMTDAGGNRIACTPADGVYTGGFEPDPAFAAEQTERILGLFEPYARYFSGDAGKEALDRVMLDGSPAYRNATAADVSWMQAHDGIRLSGQRVENIKKYSDECYSCDIGFSEEILQGGEAVRTWDTNMTWIMVRDGDYYLADLVTKNAND